jgi:ribonuclease HII
MALNLSKLSVDEIRQRYGGDGGTALTPHVLNSLKRDPRNGVRRLYEALKRRHDREREERVRLDSMLNFERILWKTGIRRIAGVDEAGTGPLAGPVVAAAVVFAPGVEIFGVDDSKKLDADERERLAVVIRETAIGIGIGTADVAEIDRLNVYHAALLAMRRAVEALPEPPQHLLVDARTIPGVAVAQNPFCKGDGINFSIAAASIVAKTHRDALMNELDSRYPEYGFAKHKGYSTPEHQDAIRRLGPCEVHRVSFTYIKELCGEYSPLFYDLMKRFDDARTAADLAAFETAYKEHADRLAENEQRKLKVLISRRWKNV